MSDPSRVIVFDGVCVLCSGWARFVLKTDRRRAFRLAAMQTPAGRRLLEQHNIDPDDPATFLVLDGQVAYTDTDALIHVLGQFDAPWPVLGGLLKCVPRGLRNALYRLVARNRYRWFGKRAQCLLPRPEDAGRFL